MSTMLEPRLEVVPPWMVIQGWFYKVLDWPLVENPSYTDQILIMKSIRQGPCPELLPLPVRLGESIDLRFRDLLHFWILFNNNNGNIWKKNRFSVIYTYRVKLKFGISLHNESWKNLFIHYDKNIFSLLLMFNLLESIHYNLV